MYSFYNEAVNFSSIVRLRNKHLESIRNIVLNEAKTGKTSCNVILHGLGCKSDVIDTLITWGFKVEEYPAILSKDSINCYGLLINWPNNKYKDWE